MKHYTRSPLPEQCSLHLLMIVVYAVIFFVCATPHAATAQVVITEVHATPSEGVSEWVEVENLGGRSVRIEGWLICDEKTCKVVTVASVPARGRVVLTGMPSLNNTTDEVWLRKADSTAVDFMRYDMSDFVAGRSIERIGMATDDGIVYEERWEACRDRDGSTPGEVNEAVRMKRDLRLEPLAAEDAAVRLEVGNVGQEAIAGGIVELGIGSTVRTVALPHLLVDDVWSTSIGLSDLGWPDATGSVAVAAYLTSADDRASNDSSTMDAVLPPELGYVVINEILFDPWPDAEDYVELMCSSGGGLDITGWYIEDERGDKGYVKDPTVLDSGHIVVLSHGSILPVMDSGAPRYMDPAVNLNSDGDVVALRTPTGFLVDMVQYRSDWHVPDLAATKGISLERLDPKLASNSASSWSSCADLKGGTPGRPNSIHLDVADLGELRASPSPFSTDRTHLLHPAVISFRQPFRHALASIVVHRTDGMVVRRLVDAQLIGVEGAVAWDGSDTDGRRVAPGQYVVVLECVDASSTAVHRDRCVVVVGD